MHVAAQQQGITLDQHLLETPNAQVGSGFMCRKCFNTFNRYLSHRDTLLANMKSAIKVIIPESSQSQDSGFECHAGQKRSKHSENIDLHTSKRVRVVEGQMHHAIRRLHFTSSAQGSPPIAVSSSE